jgi:hypothetical protein
LEYYNLCRLRHGLLSLLRVVAAAAEETVRRDGEEVMTAAKRGTTWSRG